MSAESARRAPMMNLREFVGRYVTLAGSFGNPVALSAFGLGAEETQNLCSSLDEDYHISRFLHFSHRQGQSYVVSGTPVTHLSIDRAINSVL